MQFKTAKPGLLLTPLFLIAPFFLWGTAMVAMKGAIAHTSPFFLASVRLLPAGILVLLAAWVMKLPQPKTKKAWLWIGLFALLDGLMFQSFLALGLERTGAGLGSVMIDSQPIAIALLSSFLFGEAIGFWGWLGLLIGIAGISLIGLPDAWLLNLVQGNGGEISAIGQQLLNNGQGLMLLAALSMATGTVSIRYVARHADPIVATGWHMILGGLPLLGFSLVGESQQWQNLTGNDWLALAYATIFGTAIAYGIFFYIANQENLTSFTALTFLTPVFALLFSHLWLSEVLSPLQWWGVGLTLISIFAINQRSRLETWLPNWRDGFFDLIARKAQRITEQLNKTDLLG
ncbi:MAG: DMT family transporter [Jaaginema sp. PMC 1079.18]|nr:DMT family transporter [Jaaginema sp. PMC 1080.18]MEC4853644.1 DMT family transporter [Jaaginema sp. PMC 1079.18]MEC4869060.1 DMT family transporter [Jaaginema sp. PMC 1078.18]